MAFRQGMTPAGPRFPPPLCYLLRMIWFFERGEESLRIETLLDRAAGEFVLRVHRPGEPMGIETFTDEEAFQARLDALQAQLGSESWKLNEALILNQSPDGRTH